MALQLGVMLLMSSPEFAVNLMRFSEITKDPRCQVCAGEVFCRFSGRIGGIAAKVTTCNQVFGIDFELLRGHV
ncbi:hypothetical protein AWB95_08820 [Mycobacterium celatum]|uniref:Uncharacterized protein n=1 Tax=Mycobacterium celatum TaxID=28045 RepID=A0A1X1RSQ7_MYCCE|nr:hypothetical protein AWB95_08820 [Mycobacterium celatum]